ncbi:NmrA family NAD(P)-binding protein [Amycolatopsis sp. YIM 10]|uniref:NmrA family NAD(P)-binding protein n=1 Tax=Amycolatopsis sp. YIM 10 TaxID=2653857 RepID=UPI00128FD76A|nr:NmrA family NAD(P)-binding protein [Amycolatopsis sp. YIM 10]QFU87601.1 NAD(P)H azoreductase [Amycolatopsis sp. YIM 10]
MSERKTVLVTGATGNVGGALVPLLLAEGVRVRALVRKPVTSLPDDVEQVVSDLTDPASIDATGVDAVFLVWPNFDTTLAPDVVSRLGRRVVYLSAEGVPFHAEVERAIERAVPEWTFLRPAGFATNTLTWLDQIQAGDVVRWPFAEARRSLIHEHDIAAVAARALLDDGHAGQKYYFTGPESITQAEQVRQIGEAIGRPLRFEELSVDAAREKLLARGWDPAFATGALEAWGAMVTDPEPVNQEVERITGKAPRTFRQWAIDRADAFK